MGAGALRSGGRARRAEARAAACAPLGVAVAGWSDRPARAPVARSRRGRGRKSRRAGRRSRADQIWVAGLRRRQSRPRRRQRHRQPPRGRRAGVLEFAEYNLAGGRARSHAFPSPERRRSGADAHRAPSRRPSAAAWPSTPPSAATSAMWRRSARCSAPSPPTTTASRRTPGRLWYARFQWIPFRHPGVDFTQPARGRGRARRLPAAGTKPSRALTPINHDRRPCESSSLKTPHHHQLPQPGDLAGLLFLEAPRRSPAGARGATPRRLRGRNRQSKTRGFDRWPDPR